MVNQRIEIRGLLNCLDDVEGVLLEGLGVGLAVLDDHLVGSGQIACNLVAGEGTFEQDIALFHPVASHVVGQASHGSLGLFRSR